MTTDSSLSHLLTALRVAQPDLPLAFSLGETPVNGGYHITEFRTAQVESVDCGGNRSAWTEAHFQIFDGGGGAKMPVGKFVQIAERSMDAVDGLGVAPLVVDGSPGNEGLSRYRLGAVDVAVRQVTVTLVPLTPVCRPLAVHLAEDKNDTCCAA